MRSVTPFPASWRPKAGLAGEFVKVESERKEKLHHTSATAERDKLMTVRKRHGRLREITGIEPAEYSHAEG
jgi:hypothetical protein